MPIDWIWGLIGGLLIGTGGAVYLLGNGKIMGASGIIGGLVDGSGRSTACERILFLAGVAVTPMLLMPFYREVDTHITDNFLVLAIAGLLVGVGTRDAYLAIRHRLPDAPFQIALDHHAGDGRRAVPATRAGAH